MEMYLPPKFVIAFTASAALVLSSCAAQAPSPSSVPDSGATDSAEQLQIMTTFLPITNFTQAVAGDRAQVTQLLPPNMDPHDYQATPQDVQNLTQADVLIKNGLSFEVFLTDLIANADNAALTVVDSSEGIDTELPENESAHADDDHGHAHGDVDPHIWLDPKKAVQQVENIRDALIAADPDDGEIYTSNAAAYISQLQSLDQDITQALAPYADQTFVTYHNFADHFAHSYDLEVEHLVDVPEGSASPSDVQRIIEVIETSDLKTLLKEPQQQNSAFDAITQDLAVTVSLFDPLETGGSEGLAPDYYLTVMAQNLESLQAAFDKASP